MILYKIRLIISGRVQGVFFRVFVREEAKNLNINKGFVRNLYSGEVEVLAYHKDRDVLEALIDRCKIGPPQSNVVDIVTHWESVQDQDPEYQEFKIASTK